MNRLAGKVLDFIFGAIIVAHAAVCMIFRNRKIVAILACACAMLSGAGLAAAVGNLLVVYSVFGIVFLTAEVLIPIFFGVTAFFLATIFFWAYGRVKYAEGYDLAKRTYCR